jgi:uncharacterized protein YbjT (DUF2867 family)
MAIVAVPGGTGNVGRAIVDALLATGKHQVKILSRSVSRLIPSSWKSTHVHSPTNDIS